jgi:hypothetical protein
MLEKYFVALVPSNYKYRHELETLIEKFEHDIGTTSVRSRIIEWEKVLKALEVSGLHTWNNYIFDFHRLLTSWFHHEPLKLTHDEVAPMFDPRIPNGLTNLLKIVDRVEDLLKGRDATWEVRRKNYVWEEYGIVIECDDHEILWFGVWLTYWNDSGMPLVYGMDSKNSDPAVVNEFRRVTSKAEDFKLDEGWVVAPIEQHTLDSAASTDTDVSVPIAKELEEVIVALCAIARRHNIAEAPR